MRKTWKQRLAALALAACTFLGLATPAQASSIADGSKTAIIGLAEVHNYLETTAGTRLRGRAFTYKTNDGLTGPAYCIGYGLAWTGDPLPITGKYGAPATAGAFANGFPQHSLGTFLGLYLAKNPILSGLTEDEFGYATQVAVWATLGQLGVAGTSFNVGQEYLDQPVGDVQQMRVFRAVQLILNVAATWSTVYQTGMYIRVSDDQLDGNLAIPPDMTLDFAADNERYGLKREVINGKSYYTKEYIFATATSSYYQDYTLDLWATGCPAGTIFTDLFNIELPRSKWHDTDTWRVQTEHHNTSINCNGFEYSARAKICIPVDTAPNKGEITLHCAAQIMQYEIYLANNVHQTQQSYIIADPSKGTKEAEAVLSWGSKMTEFGTLEVFKVDGGGSPLAGAAFALDGTDGSHRTGTTDDKGVIRWEKLDPDVTYTLTETEPPAGYSVVEPMTVRVKAARIEYVTVRDDPQHTLTVHKIDRQTGYSLRGAVICFEQIDGDYTTTAVTDHAGLIQFDADQLPVGSYRIYEVTAPEGYELNPTSQTVHWDGERDITLTINNVRQPTFIISKQDARTNYNLPGATMEVYRDGRLVTTVTTNEAGLAYVPGVTEGYYEVKETVAPTGYVLNSKVYGVNIDPYDPATTDDPRLVIENDPFPSLRIIKYDRISHKGMASVTFEVFRDTVSLGKFQTDSEGEILLPFVAPGTYRVVEVDTGDDGHILDTTPQEIELRAGDDVHELVFFNDRLPGLHLIKVDSANLSKPIPNARFRFAKVGGGYGPVEYASGADGTIDLSKLPVGSYVVTELECPGYVVDNAQRIIHLDGNDQAQFVFTNSKLPSLHLTKYSADGTPLAGVSYRLAKIEDGSHYLDRITSTRGEITWDGLNPGVYSLQEIDTLDTHILDEVEYHVEVFPGKNSEVVFYNDRRPSLTIHKTNADDSTEPVPDTVFIVKSADGSTIGEYKTGSDGSVTVHNLLPGVYEVSEQSVPSPYLLDAPAQTVTLYPNRDIDVYFENHKAPVIEIIKESSITHDPIPNVRFQVWYASNNTATGELNDLGIFTTDANGRIDLTGPANGLRNGWFRVRELAPAPGYAIKDSNTQEVFIPAGKGYSFHFENTPLSAAVVWKYDKVSGAALSGCRFQLRYLGGEVSGSEGTIIGTYTTSKNGAFTATGLKVGYYICEEIASDGDHVIDTAPQSFYISGKDQDIVTLYFGNAPKGNLLVSKVSTDEKHMPLSDVEFLVTKADGTLIGDANGKFVTDSTGSFLVKDVVPGTTLVVKEVRAKAGYLLDDTPQTATIQAGQTVSLEFRNQPLGNLVIEKLGRTGSETVPLSGVKFEIKYADGTYVDSAGGKQSSNGIYYTNSNGRITLSGIVGTVIVTELESVEGYSIDPNTQSQTVTVTPDDTQTLRFYNNAVGGVEIIKVNEDNRSERIPNTSFEIRRMDGGLVDTITTGRNGRAYLSLEDGGYYAVEVEAENGFNLDATPHYFTIKNGRTTTVTVTNKAFSGILLHKVDSTTGAGIPNVTFLLYDGKMNPIEQFTTSQRGYAYIDDLPSSGRFYLRELENDGYMLDKQLKTIYVRPGETAEITWENVPVTGQIQVYKYAAEANPVAGTAAGTPLQGAVYEISEARGGKVVDYITTDAHGVAASKPLPLNRYKIREVTAPSYWQVNPTVYDETLEYAGQIIKLSAYDRPVSLGVSITKRGNVEVLAGSQMRYDITVANTSNVALESFHWHDKIPYDVARATVLTTGTYSARLNYRVLYKTNYSVNYQVLASNLLTSNNYSFALNAIPMQAGEVVTDVYFDFGTVPVGFQSVAKPTLTVQVLTTAANGYQLINRADVGGKYQGTWQTANANWVTIVRKLVVTPPPTLPKTGY